MDDRRYSCECYANANTDAIPIRIMVIEAFATVN